MSAITSSQSEFKLPNAQEHKNQAIIQRIAQVIRLLALSIFSSFLALNFFRRGWFIGVVLDVIGSFSFGTFLYERAQKKVQHHWKWHEIASDLKPADDSHTPQQRLGEAQHNYHQKKFEQFMKLRGDRLAAGKAKNNPSFIEDADEAEQQAAWSKICQAYFSNFKDGLPKYPLKNYCVCRFQNFTARAIQSYITPHIQNYNYFVISTAGNVRLTTEQILETSISEISKLLFNSQL